VRRARVVRRASRRARASACRGRATSGSPRSLPTGAGCLLALRQYSRLPWAGRQVESQFPEASDLPILAWRTARESSAGGAGRARQRVVAPSSAILSQASRELSPMTCFGAADVRAVNKRPASNTLSVGSRSGPGRRYPLGTQRLRRTSRLHTENRPANAGLFGERLMGFEPTTFCMASRTGGDWIYREVPANQRFCGRPSAAGRSPEFAENSRGFGYRIGTQI
jgi:hypothetical protein